MNPLILQMLLAELRKRGVPEDALADYIDSPESQALLAQIQATSPQSPTISPAMPVGPQSNPMAPVGRGAALGPPQPFSPNAPVVRGPIGSTGSSNFDVGMPKLPPAPFEFMGSEPFQPIPSQFAGMEGTDLGAPSAPTSAASTPIPSPAVKASGVGMGMGNSGAELPYQTFEKFTGNKWSGGASPEVMALLEELGVQGQAGSADTNLALQKAMMSRMSMPPTNVEGPADMQNVSPQGLAQFAQDFGSEETPLPATPIAGMPATGIAPSILNSVRLQPMRKKFLVIF